MKRYLILTILLFNFAAKAQLNIKPNHSGISYQGRVVVNSDSASIYWPGSSISLNFKGASVDAKLKSAKEDAYFYVIVDDSIRTKIEILKDKPTQLYRLVSNLDDKQHRLTLFKLSNSTSANKFYGFILSGEAKVLKTSKLPTRRIEFYGNSITAGHGVDTPTEQKDSGEPKYFNNYYTYAAITARHFNAQYYNTSRSGIGVMVSWFAETMSETYNRINPLDSTNRWDFNKYQPQVIVVNLFQNDAWLVNNPSNPQFKARFGARKPNEEFIVNSYKSFIAKLENVIQKQLLYVH
ncbi:electron transporter RnfD [Nubsella zeaxanthinifaciens]|uniref:electron transporter RnfD n=1 Tax=Nubsella zeaxanthinifaciens TaxID=392412 RepID=UPI000DE3158D|nr:electron transporter RnfD [Nubsella zeaxanthinifaciens]